jgi:putative Mg2+ transporter-C (MgtC) family protein
MFEQVPDLAAIVLNIALAWIAGVAIGLERTYHGRPAGFRTHALVALASAILVVTTVHQADWTGDIAPALLRIDPLRMAQGIMTGIGFLGAGVIFKEGLTVRGLTTAASIWVTAAIGILFGAGFWFPATLATLITLGTLGAFRLVEAHIPIQIFAQHIIRFPTERIMSEPDLRAMLEAHHFTISNFAYRLEEGGGVFEYRMTLMTRDARSLERLANHLRNLGGVLEFRLAPNQD